MNRHPSGFGSLLSALEEQLAPTRTIIVTGAARAFAPWREMLDRAFMPTTLVVYVPAGTAGLPAVLAKPAEDRVRAWICEGTTCLAPLDSLEDLRAHLDLQKMPALSQATLTHGSSS
jgi:uncharacterized protein YyaL (SSP411 family)